MWIGLLHHVTGEHEWSLDACQNDPLLSDRERDWIQKGSTPHKALSDIILSERWLKEVPKYLKFRKFGGISQPSPNVCKQKIQLHPTCLRGTDTACCIGLQSPLTSRSEEESRWIDTIP
uniref:Uncharacterized protein n=1 Tax=Nothobranchius furzeri TaxID=105023 RepID=A0A1A7ZJD2_NOTFU